MAEVREDLKTEEAHLRRNQSNLTQIHPPQLPITQKESSNLNQDLQNVSIKDDGEEASSPLRSQQSGEKEVMHTSIPQQHQNSLPQLPDFPSASDHSLMEQEAESTNTTTDSTHPVEEPEDCGSDRGPPFEVASEVTVVVADSNLTATHSAKLDIIAESGANLENIGPMLNKARTKKPHIDNLVIALGINDFSNTQSTGATSALFNKAITKAQTVIPEAHIFLSGIVPRKETSTHLKATNNQLHEVNNFLKDIAKGSDKISYIGNASTFRQSSPENLYVKKDTLHLNSVGRAKLVNIIETHVEKRKTPIKKRPRSLDTPTSAEKDAKQHRGVEGSP